MSKREPTWMDGILGSQLRDTQGEILDVAGADISDLQAGRGRWNDNHGKGFFNSIGRITEAKKIFKAEDCENDRHRYYWDKIKAPYIYGAGYLYDDEDHPNARAAAAILRNIHKSDSPLKLKLSVEGGVLARGIKDPSILARTKIHSCAVTFTPANNATLVEPLHLNKSYWDADADAELIKSVAHLAETNVPSFRHITRHASASRIINNIEAIRELAAELGIPEDKIPLPSKDQLIKQAVEHKIYENVKKINNLMQELNKAEQLYHIHKDGFKVTSEPVSLAHVNQKYGGTKKLEASSHILVPHQPELNKARPNAVETTHYDIGKPGVEYTGKDAHNAQMHVVKQLINKDVFPGKHYKNMINEETGKPELHVAVHRGIGSNFDPNAEGENKFKVTDTHIEPKTHSVHTLHHSVAKDYAGKDGQTISSWVPVSKINALAEYHDSGIKDKRIPIPEDMRTTKIMVAPDSKTPGKFKDDTTGWTYDKKVIPENDAREDMSYDPHSNSQKHISIKPGKYRRLSEQEIKELKPELNKALTAGYGGAGAPTSRSGGSVIQSESLEDGRSLKYIGCDDCGKEQVYSKYQVKCRHCNKSFPLEKLYGLITSK